MKKTITLLGICLLIFTSLQFNACAPDENDDIITDNRAKFLGTWTVQESCIRLYYDVVIIADAAVENKVWMQNFALPSPEFNNPAYGFVNGNSIDMPQQVIGDNWMLNGSGKLQDDGRIIWNYYLEIGGDGSNCEAEYEK